MGKWTHTIQDHVVQGGATGRIIGAKFLTNREGIYKHGNGEGLKESEILHWNWSYHYKLVVL